MCGVWDMGEEREVFQDGSDVSLSCLYAKFKVGLLSFF